MSSDTATIPEKKPRNRSVATTRRPNRGTSRINAPRCDNPKQEKILAAGVNRNVAPRGYAVDGKELENVKQFGFPSPREHFIYGPADLNANMVATIWGLEPRSVYMWAKEDGWHELRDAQLAQREPSQGGTLITDKALVLRDAQTEQELEHYDELLDLAMTRARAIKEEINTALGPAEIKKTDKSFATIASTVMSIHEKRRIAVGLHVKTAGAFEGANITVNQVKEIIVESPSQSERERYRMESMKALEAGEEANCIDVVEGEVSP